MAKWEQLHDSLLGLAMDGDPDEAERDLKALVAELPDGPARGEALNWLAYARLQQGKIPEARDALRECVRTDASPRCHPLLWQLDLREQAIRKLPVRWTFDEPVHGFVLFSDEGSIEILPDPLDGDIALAWGRAASEAGDHLSVAFALGGQVPRGVRFQLRSEKQGADVRIVVYDSHGRAFGANAPRSSVTLPAGDPVLVTVDFADLQPLDGRERFVATAIDRLEIRDVTTFSVPSRATPVMWLDDFEAF